VPSTKAYGAVSVLIQLVAERTGFHPVSRHRLPSQAQRRVGDRRLPPDRPARELRATSNAIVEAAFAHRRKKLANSLELAGIDTTYEAIPDVRAEELAPADFLELAEQLR
jgi:16S rRNA A1518/A1519 N6-dimethyltransferase RsmA/KsgA/DIM1 with predicted DNA glycosylase/AP lyase activity